MSLKLLTNKLKRQSLAESGTPVELQTPNDPEMESDDDEFNANKDLENCLASSSPSKPSCHPNIPHCSAVDFCNDNYSSEEELKEIIYSERHRKRTGGRKSATPHRAFPSASSSKTPTSPNQVNGSHPAEKRKWSEISSCHLCTNEGCKSGLCLCDKNDNFDGGVHDIFGHGISSTPVQFCTSPPVDVHKPRHHSSSPPAKVFHLSQSFEEKTNTGFRPQQFMAAFKPSVGILEVNVAGHRLLGQNQFEEDSDLNSGTSPNKRPRSTPGPQQMQRPCLDFEKMQQIHTKVVTSWRTQGTELSIFCW